MNYFVNQMMNKYAYSERTHTYIRTHIAFLDYIIVMIMKEMLVRFTEVNS